MKEGLEAFVQKYADTDVFCFQEVYHEAEGKDTIWLDNTNFNLLAFLRERMPGYQSFYHPHLRDYWGLAMFIKKGIEVVDSGEVYVHKHKDWNYDLEVQGYTAKNLQYVTIRTTEGTYTVINFHGLWNGQGKLDSEERVRQSENIIAFLKTLEHPYILCGDFNLNPETVSLTMLEGAGMRNLVKEYGITSTRTPLYQKEGRYADYILVSGEVETLDFSVLPEVVSDHSPLYLEWK